MNAATAATIRPAVRADIPRLVAIRGSVRENRLSDERSIGPADYLPFIEGGRCWVAEDAGGSLIGFAALDAEAASVWALFVAPEAEGRGAGRALLDRLVDEACARDLTVLQLETEAGSRAERLYRAAGWMPAGADAKGTLLFRLAL